MESPAARWAPAPYSDVQGRAPWQEEVAERVYDVTAALSANAAFISQVERLSALTRARPELAQTRPDLA